MVRGLPAFPRGHPCASGCSPVPVCIGHSYPFVQRPSGHFVIRSSGCSIDSFSIMDEIPLLKRFPVFVPHCKMLKSGGSSCSSANVLLAAGRGWHLFLPLLRQKLHILGKIEFLEEAAKRHHFTELFRQQVHCSGP